MRLLQHHMRRSYCQYSIAYGSLNKSLTSDESVSGLSVTINSKRNRRKFRLIFSIGFNLFCRHILQFELNLQQQTLRQWTGMPRFGCSMTVFNVRPNDAPIFRACQEWDLSRVKYLLESGQASVYDVEDEIGGLLEVRTPKITTRVKAE